MPPKKKSGCENRKRKLVQQQADAKHPKIIDFSKKIKLSDIEPNESENKCLKNAYEQSISGISKTSAEVSVDNVLLENKLIKLTNQLKVTSITQSEGTEKHKCTTISYNQSVEEISEISTKDSEGISPEKSDIIDAADQPDLSDQNLNEISDISDFLKTLASEKFPTDKGHYETNIILSEKVKKFILKNGSCRPTGNFPKDKKNQSFSDDVYFSRTKNGLELPRKWLCYSPNWTRVIVKPVGYLVIILNEN